VSAPTGPSVVVVGGGFAGIGWAAFDNLYVVDTSFFPSIGAVNPAVTAMANARRVGDHLIGRLG
jgi:hypothetical protein